MQLKERIRTMRDYKKETDNRLEFISNYVQTAKAKGIVYGNSGGKDSALVGILSKMACPETVGLIMPCCSNRNFNQDKEDGLLNAKKFNIETVVFDLSDLKNNFLSMLSKEINVSDMASNNISPRLRMITLYAYGASRNFLVAGTGNRSEAYMGYFTKWGDGAHDFNPIADLTVTEIYEYLKYLGAPSSIIDKAPSAGLFDGQTDEGEMGITYAKIDNFLLHGEANPEDKIIIDRYHTISKHKREMPTNYGR
jgi:NAD+ synthase